MTLPDGYRIKCGWVVPDSDVRGVPAMHAMVGLLNEVYKHCKGFDVAVQAGGCVGIYPAAMSAKFGTVYTFEPDPVNFRCLCANAPQENVFKFNAALGDVHQRVGLERNAENIGAHYVAAGGDIPTLLIDDLYLSRCDLIYLDIEGYEHRALNGARQTIARLKPVIVIEDKGCSERYGYKQGETVEWLRAHYGYRVADKMGRDVVLAC